MLILSYFPKCPIQFINGREKKLNIITAGNLRNASSAAHVATKNENISAKNVLRGFFPKKNRKKR